MAIDIISTDRIYKFERVHIIEMWLNVKALGNLGGVEWKSLAKFAVHQPKLKTLGQCKGQVWGGGGGGAVAPLCGNSSPSPIREVQCTGKNYVL
jgi:hypothetical protein